MDIRGYKHVAPPEQVSLDQEPGTTRMTFVQSYNKFNEDHGIIRLPRRAQASQYNKRLLNGARDFPWWRGLFAVSPYVCIIWSLHESR